MDSSNTFDKMVSGISREERKSILEKLQTQELQDLPSEVNESVMADEIPLEEDTPDLETSLKKESLLFRFWIWFKALIKSDSIQNVYNDELVVEMARKISKDVPDLIDYKRKYLLVMFYNSLVEIQHCIDFFKPYVELYEENEGAFLVLLGSIIMPGVDNEIETQVDPYNMSFDRQITGELRVSLIHKMDDILKDLPAKERAIMYSGARAIEWLKHFVKLPVKNFLGKFTQVFDGTYSCNFSSIDSELAQCARILIKGYKISNAVLEALYLFSMRNEAGEALDIDSGNGGATEFIQKATTELSMINTFITNIPLSSIGCIVYNNAKWRAEPFGGGEDWFVKFKSQWRKVFDSRWESWVRDCKKEKLRVRLQDYFGLTSFPQFPYRPWKEISSSLTFRYELTLGFLHSFYTSQYNEYMKPMKVVLLEGQFRQKDNQSEFSEQMNVLGALGQELKALGDKLKDTGEYGAILEKFEHRGLFNSQVEMQVESVMSEMEDTVSIIIRRFGNACRILGVIISGILGQSLDTRYDSLININTVHGHENKQFRRELADTQIGLVRVLEMLTEIESIDVPVLAK